MPAPFNIIVFSILAGLLAMAAPVVAQAELKPVAAIGNAQKLVGVDVVDTNGDRIGTVLAVKTGSDGQVSRLKVMLKTGSGGGRVAVMRPEKLSLNTDVWPLGSVLLVSHYSAAELTQLAQTATTPHPDIDWVAARP